MYDMGYSQNYFMLFVNFLSFSLLHLVCFDETHYSEILGGVTIVVTTNKDFTSSFAFTVTRGDPG